MTDRPGRRDALQTAGAAIAFGLLALLATCLPGRGPVRLNFGPGDGPYVQGFAGDYEIEDKIATHWTTYHAALALPLEVAGRATLALRYSRIFGETAQVDIRLAGQPVDHFSARGGGVVEREIALGVLPPTALDIGIESDSHEGRNLGLKLDWMQLDVPSVKLRGAARLAPVLAIVLLLLLHRLAGWSALQAAGFTAPWLLLLAFGLHADPWLVHQLLRGMPMALALFGLTGVLVGRRLATAGRATPETVRRLAALALLAFMARGLLVSHPDFYYPDQRTHARLVEKLQEGGLDFFVSPAKYIWAHGVWRTEAYGRTYAFPYTPAFHLPFAPLFLPYDDLLVAMKLTAAAITTVPLILLFALARRLGASPLGTLLMLLIPTYTSRLSFAFLPALLGHAMDIALLYWLCGHLSSLSSRRGWLTGAAFVAACQLAYISSVMNVSVLIAALAVTSALVEPERRGRRFLTVLGMGLAGSMIAVALYYRDFLGMVFDLLPRIAGHAPGGSVSRYPVQSFFAVAYERTHDFFDGMLPLLALGGLVLLLRRGRAGRSLLVAWLAAYALLLFGRAKVPDVFLHGHETLFVTPLVCLAAGEALHWLWRSGSWRRVLSVALLFALAVQGALLQWQSIADQLGNAR